MYIFGEENYCVFRSIIMVNEHCTFEEKKKL